MKKSPNVIFIIADQHRWDFLGWRNDNGETLTPNLDSLAAGGVIFDNAFCTSPLCSPSRAAIASGRYGMNSGCFTNLNELPPATPSFVTQLRDSGYQTAAVGKTHMEIHAYDSDLTAEKHKKYMDSLGWDYVCGISGNGMLKTGIKCEYSEYLKKEGVFEEVLSFYRRWHYFMDQRSGFSDFHSEEWPLADKYQETHFVAEKAMEWLNARDNSKPFFLHLGFAGPHSPIEPHKTFLEMYRDKIETVPFAAESDEEILAARKGYRAMITQIDHYVGELVSLIEKEGELENTIFIYTADHGEMAGDFGRTGKTCFYEASIRVPFIVSGSQIKISGRSEVFTELIDIGKTVCELCGVETHQYDQGKSLLPVLKGLTERHRETIYAEMGADKMLFDGRYKLMLGDSGSDLRKLGKLHLDKPVNISPGPAKLYDLTKDPKELDDLSDKKEHQPLFNLMKEKLLLRLNYNAQTQIQKSRGKYNPL